MTRRSICGVRSLVLAIWVFAINSVAQAADKFWGAPFGGTFSDAINWQGGSVAGMNDIAHFGLTNNPILLQRIYTVGFTTDATNQALKVEDDFVTFDLNSRIYTTTSATGNEIGNVAGRSGRLTITDGTVIVAFQSNLDIGPVANSSGTLTVSTGGLLIGSPSLFVGDLGTGTLTIQNNGDVIAGIIGFGTGAGATGTGTITGAGSSLLTDSLAVGNFGSGTLNVTGGGRVDSNFVFIGDSAGGTGAVTVSGANSQWTNSGYFSVGGLGTATLDIVSGGRVQNKDGYLGNLASGSGSVTVSGADSEWTNSGQVTVGVHGSGTMNIAAGGRVSSAVGDIGEAANSTGTVNVDGANSQWTNSGELIIGDGGAGTLNITAGGQVDNTSGYVGLFSGGNSSVTVSGANSQWTNASSLTVGSFGTGTLDINSGGRVQNTDAYLGYNPSVSGSVTVSGANSQWINSGQVIVGRNGSGTLNITAGGRVQNTDGFVARLSGNSTATVSGAGSIWTMTGRLSMGGDAGGGTNGGTGTLNIQSGGTVSVAQDTAIFPSGLVRLEGGTFSTSAITVQSGGHFIWTSGTLHAGVVNFDLQNPSGGVLAPGASAGTTVIQGNYTQQNGAVLQMEIGGTAAISTYDFVNITGAAALNGQLQLSLLGAFRPNVADRFTILSTFGGLTGAFSNVVNGQRLTTFDGNGSFLVHYGGGTTFDPKQIVLTDFLEAVALPGDYNQNGVVDAADYIVWRKSLDQMGTGLAADGNGNNQIDPGDYNVWRAHFGQTAGSGSGTGANAAVPEPATLALLILAAAGSCFRRRRAV